MLTVELVDWYGATVPENATDAPELTLVGVAVSVTWDAVVSVTTADCEAMPGPVVTAA